MIFLVARLVEFLQCLLVKIMRVTVTQLYIHIRLFPEGGGKSNIFNKPVFKRIQYLSWELRLSLRALHNLFTILHIWYNWRTKWVVPDNWALLNCRFQVLSLRLLPLLTTTASNILANHYRSQFSVAGGNRRWWAAISGGKRKLRPVLPKTFSRPGKWNLVKRNPIFIFL